MTESQYKSLYNDLFVGWIAALDANVKEATKEIEFDFQIGFRENARNRAKEDLKQLNNFFFNYQAKYIDEADKKAGFELISEIVMKTISK